MSPQSFRNIRPSIQNDAGGEASGTSAQGFDPQQVDQSPNSGPPGRRRAQPLSVTANACIMCKKAKAKCDGKQPCGRCATRNALCTYETHIKMAKENMVKQIKDLQGQLRSRLRDETNTLEETVLCRQVLGAIREDNHVAQIVEKLQKGESLRSIVDSLGLVAIAGSNAFPLIRDDSTPMSIDEVDGVNVDTTGQPEADGRNPWTDTIIDQHLLQRLLILYFQWIHPVHTLFSESHFMGNYTRHLHSHCSSALVNAIFALACRFLEPAEVDKLPNRDDVYLLSRRFAAEARSQLSSEIASSLTKIQTSSILSLVAEGDGDMIRAKAYLDAAIDIMERLMMEGVLDNEASKVTSRGIYVLVVTCEETSYQIFDANVSLWDTSNSANQKDTTDGVMENSGQDAEISEWSDFSAIISEARVQMTRVTVDTIRLFYSSNNLEISATQILDLYLRYLTWRDELPDILKDVAKEDSKFHPHILLLHVQYHVAVLQLLQPCGNVEWMGSKTAITPHKIATESAESGFRLLQYHRSLYSSKFSTRSQLVYLVQTCYAVIRLSGVDGPNSLQSVARFCYESLNDSYTVFTVAASLHESFRRSLMKIHIGLPSTMSESMTKAVRDEVLFADATFEQPVDMIAARFEPSLVDNWADPWTSITNTGVFQRKNDINRLIRRLSGQHTGKYLHIEALLNDP